MVGVSTVAEYLKPLLRREVSEAWQSDGSERGQAKRERNPASLCETKIREQQGAGALTNFAGDAEAKRWKFRARKSGGRAAAASKCCGDAQKNVTHMHHAQSPSIQSRRFARPSPADVDDVADKSEQKRAPLLHAGRSGSARRRRP
jgi:hypothetical protein